MKYNHLISICLSSLAWIPSATLASDAVEVDGFFFDGVPGCYSKGGTISLTSFTVECEGGNEWGGGAAREEDYDCDDDDEDCLEEMQAAIEAVENYESPFDLCEFGQEMVVSGTFETNFALPQYVRVKPKICHNSGLTCSNEIAQSAVVDMCDIIEKDENDDDSSNGEAMVEDCEGQCEESCDYGCSRYNNGNNGDGGDGDDGYEQCQQTCQEGCAENCQTIYKSLYSCPSAGSYSFETSFQLNETFAEDFFSDFSSFNFKLRLTLLPVSSSSSRPAVYCHIPFHLVDSENFDMESYMKATRSSYVSVSAVTAGFALFGLYQWSKRRRPAINLNEEEERASSSTNKISEADNGANFVVFE